MINEKPVSKTVMSDEDMALPMTKSTYAKMLAKTEPQEQEIGGSAKKEKV
jgi:hypothetical protein